MMVVECLKREMEMEDMTCYYFYRLVRDQISLNVKGEKVDVQAYGIEIERQDFIDDIMINIERDSINSISPQRHKVHNLLRLVYENEVSPYHLIDVLGEYVDEYIADFDNAMAVTAAYN